MSKPLLVANDKIIGHSNTGYSHTFKLNTLPANAAFSSTAS